MQGKPLPKDELVKKVRRLVVTHFFQIKGHGLNQARLRGITYPEVQDILSHGEYVESRTRFDEEEGTWTYVFEGQTAEGELLRVVVYFKGQPLLPDVFLMVKTAYYPKKRSSP